jgi:hypothetical protein
MILNHELEFPLTETATDCCGNLRRFRVELHETESGYFLRAHEETGDAAGYEFAAHSESSPYLALGRLRARIQEGLATRYLRIEEHRRSFSHDMAVGTIGYGSVIIDGQEIPFEELVNMMQTYEGFQFSLRIVDPYETL